MFLQVFLIFGVAQIVSPQYIKCEVLNVRGVTCNCLETYELVLCDNRHLGEMPVFQKGVAKHVRQLHVEYNQISFWPSSSYWQNFEKLENLIAEDNYVCHPPENAPAGVKFFLFPCITTTTESK